MPLYTFIVIIATLSHNCIFLSHNVTIISQCLSVQQYIAIATLYLLLNFFYSMAEAGFHWSPSFVVLDAGVSVSFCFP